MTKMGNLLKHVAVRSKSFTANATAKTSGESTPPRQRAKRPPRQRAKSLDLKDHNSTSRDAPPRKKFTPATIKKAPGADDSGSDNDGTPPGRDPFSGLQTPDERTPSRLLSRLRQGASVDRPPVSSSPASTELQPNVLFKNLTDSDVEKKLPAPNPASRRSFLSALCCKSVGTGQATSTRRGSVAEASHTEQDRYETEIPKWQETVAKGLSNTQIDLMVRIIVTESSDKSLAKTKTILPDLQYLNLRDLGLRSDPSDCEKTQLETALGSKKYNKVYEKLQHELVSFINRNMDNRLSGATSQLFGRLMYDSEKAIYEIEEGKVHSQERDKIEEKALRGHLSSPANSGFVVREDSFFMRSGKLNSTHKVLQAMQLSAIKELELIDTSKLTKRTADTYEMTASPVAFTSFMDNSFYKYQDEHLRKRMHRAHTERGSLETMRAAVKKHQKHSADKTFYAEKEIQGKMHHVKITLEKPLAFEIPFSFTNKGSLERARVNNRESYTDCLNLLLGQWKTGTAAQSAMAIAISGSLAKSPENYEAAFTAIKMHATFTELTNDDMMCLNALKIGLTNTNSAVWDYTLQTRTAVDRWLRLLHLPIGSRLMPERTTFDGLDLKSHTFVEKDPNGTLEFMYQYVLQKHLGIIPAVSCKSGQDRTGTAVALMIAMDNYKEITGEFLNPAAKLPWANDLFKFLFTKAADEFCQDSHKLTRAAGEDLKAKDQAFFKNTYESKSEDRVALEARVRKLPKVRDYLEPDRERLLDMSIEPNSPILVNSKDPVTKIVQRLLDGEEAHVETGDGGRSSLSAGEPGAAEETGGGGRSSLSAGEPGGAEETKDGGPSPMASGGGSLGRYSAAAEDGATGPDMAPSSGNPKLRSKASQAEILYKALNIASKQKNLSKKAIQEEMTLLFKDQLGLLKKETVSIPQKTYEATFLEIQRHLHLIENPAVAQMILSAIDRVLDRGIFDSKKATHQITAGALSVESPTARTSAALPEIATSKVSATAVTALGEALLAATSLSWADMISEPSPAERREMARFKNMLVSLTTHESTSRVWQHHVAKNPKIGLMLFREFLETTIQPQDAKTIFAPLNSDFFISGQCTLSKEARTSETEKQLDLGIAVLAKIKHASKQTTHKVLTEFSGGFLHGCTKETLTALFKNYPQ